MTQNAPVEMHDPADSRATDALAVAPVNEQAAEQAESTTTAEQPDAVRTPQQRATASSVLPLAAALGTVGVALISTVLGLLLKRPRKPASKAETKAEAKAEARTASEEVTARATSGLAQAQHPASGLAVDLSPFGSPVGGTPARIAAAQGKIAAARCAESDIDDAGSDNASVRDQRQGAVDAAALQKMLRQMQEMADENRKLSAFLAEHKASTEKLLRLEQENQALRDVTNQLEDELKEIKTVTAAALPRTGAELEAFKRNVSRVPNAARSVCSNDETVVLGISTASVDEGARMQRTNVFKTLLANLSNIGGTPSAGNSVATTPRGSTGGAGSQPLQPVGGSSRGRRGPAPEEAAAIGQAVYQLLDQFGGRMM